MKKVISKIVICLVLVTMAVSCKDDRFWVKGEGANVTNTRVETGFNAVALSIGADVQLYHDSVYRIELNGKQNILNLIETNVSGNTLHIRLKNCTSIRKHNPITLKIYMPDLNSLDLSGSGDVSCMNGFTTDVLSTNISGSGSITFQGQVNSSFTANISGSGSISNKSNGTCSSAKYTISGSGNINAEWLKADYVDAHVSGSGNQKIYAVKQLNAHISGSGDVAYRGTPAMTVQISGSGKVYSIQ